MARIYSNTMIELNSQIKRGFVLTKFCKNHTKNKPNKSGGGGKGTNFTANGIRDGNSMRCKSWRKLTTTWFWFPQRGKAALSNGWTICSIKRGSVRWATMCVGVVDVVVVYRVSGETSSHTAGKYNTTAKTRCIYIYIYSIKSDCV